MALYGESSFLDLRASEACFITQQNERVPGSFRCTNYMVYFHPKAGASPPSFRHIPLSFFRIPLGLIERIRLPDTKSGRKRAKQLAKTGNLHVITLYCRDVRVLQFGFAVEQLQAKVYNLLKVLAFPAKISDTFAFSHMNKQEHRATTGWEVYDLKGEFIRQGVFDVKLNSRNTWKELTLNHSYEFCSTYPNVIVVPAKMSEAQLRRVAAFRSRERIPAFTWIHPGNHTTLWRSSQPMVGVGGNSCADDEGMLNLIRGGSTASASKPTLVADCRPMLNAMGNKAAGKGWEQYKNMTIEFFGIHSIHVMRDSFTKLKNLCLSNAALSNIFKDTEWASQVEDTGWLKHVRTVLTGGIRIAVGMHRQGLSVLCHCSDGWDRTAQCVCIAQLCMDPYYRTVRGFCGLIAKDWLAFGHKFQHRIGHADPKYDDSERSPVFIQFLDCVWQLVHQFPSAFEFNARLLLFLAHHLFSCRFGDFLFTCERERVDAALATCTPSIWGYVLQHRKLYTNPTYNAEGGPVLLPAASVVCRNVKLWAGYYLRFSPVPSCVPRVAEFEGYDVAAGASEVANQRQRESARLGAGAGAGAGAGSGAGSPSPAVARLAASGSSSRLSVSSDPGATRSPRVTASSSRHSMPATPPPAPVAATGGGLLNLSDPVVGEAGGLHAMAGDPLSVTDTPVLLHASDDVDDAEDVDSAAAAAAAAAGDDGAADSDAAAGADFAPESDSDSENPFASLAI